jgi:hypothetical protein
VNNPEWKDGTIVKVKMLELDQEIEQIQFRGYYFNKDKPRCSTPLFSGLQSLILETAQKQAIEKE